jgi:hypothetical protein
MSVSYPGLGTAAAPIGEADEADAYVELVQLERRAQFLRQLVQTHVPV